MQSSVTLVEMQSCFNSRVKRSFQQQWENHGNRIAIMVGESLLNLSTFFALGDIQEVNSTNGNVNIIIIDIQSYMSCHLIKAYIKQVQDMFFMEPLVSLITFSGTSFIEVYIKMTTSVRSFQSRDFSACTDPPLDTLFMSFWKVASPIILKKYDIKIFQMVI